MSWRGRPRIAHELQRRALFVSHQKERHSIACCRTKKDDPHRRWADRKRTNPAHHRFKTWRRTTRHIAVPLIKAGEVVGAFTIYRTEVRPFTDKQIELVENFAAQAVIAIENTRLLQRAALGESLQQQTATAGRAQSHQPFDVRSPRACFDTLVESAVRLCEAERGLLFRRDARNL